MASEAAQLLDQLMGATRNAVPGEDVKEISWSDEEVCKNYLCGFCPSELFINTKAEATVGPCYKVHDERLRKVYEEVTDKEDCGYQDMFLAYLERLVRDLDKKVDRGKDRLRRSAQAKQQSLHGDGPGSDKLKQLNLDIDAHVKELQCLGEQGRVEETHDLMMKLEQLERERETERMASSNSAPKVLAGFELDSNDFHEKMELCDVCGSFLVIGDTQSRVDAHLLGKQHIGFARIRTAIADLKSKKEDRLITKQKELAQRRQQQQQEEVRSHRRHSHRGHSRERRITPSREKSRRGSPSHSRRADKRRRYSRRSHSRSHSRDKKSRSHSRDRRRSRSKSTGRKRSRSHSKEKKCRSRRRSRSHSVDRRSSRSSGRKKERSLSKESRMSSKIQRARSSSKEKAVNKRNGAEDVER